MLDMSKQFETIKECSDHFKICRTSLKCKKCNIVFPKLNVYHAHANICNGLDQ